MENNTKVIKINNEYFHVNENEYNKIETPPEFCNLIILENLDIHERIVSLINELSLLFNEKIDILFHDITNGGYIPIKCFEYFKNLYVYNISYNNENIVKNIINFNIENISFELNLDVKILYFNNNQNKFIDNINIPIILCDQIFLDKIDSAKYKVYYLSETNLILCITNDLYDIFYKNFYYYINNDILSYNNLLHLTMIVKNAGDTFEDVLNENIRFIDRWTILDTGSTDNTIEIINKVLVGKKKGELYQEPFINFRDSRNRCLDLAGKSCKFLVMLDDTYVLKNDVRNFLNIVRGDQFSDSFSFYILSNDVEYSSNRIIKSATNLRYKYKLHEVITPKNNVNVMIPITSSYIFDVRSDYMENRTMERKKYDLQILYEMVDEEPEDSRALYYLGQTYNLIKNHELAYKYFLERVDHPDEGFLQEKIDACFEAGRISNFQLNKPWEESKKLYEKAYSMDKTRPDSLYFLGIHYYLEKDYKLAYDYFKDAFRLGYPSHCQYSLKPTLSFYFLPKFLTEVCYYLEDYKLGLEASEFFLKFNKLNEKGEQPFKDIFNQTEYDIVLSWNSIFKCLNIIPNDIKIIQNIPSKPYMCFLTDGGFEKWTGRDILKKGIGGSETFVIEIAKHIQKLGIFQTIVFCNCNEPDVFEDVIYKPFMEFFNFITYNQIHSCIVGRYSEYIPVCLKSINIKNVYFILHDTMPTGIVIPFDFKLKKVFCLSDWHVKHFTNTFPALKDITYSFNYGIDTKLYIDNKIEKIPYKFIYSSFPNRGLLPLLQMWKKIVNRYPQASLHIHCDLENNWVNTQRPEEMKMIKSLLNELLSKSELNIKLWGWTDKNTLLNNWLSSDIWFYPCTFLETFCHTALEAAASKTFVITRNFGALEDTVGNRGAMLESDNLYDPYNDEWQQNNLNKLFDFIDNKKLREELVERNYNWAMNMSWERRAQLFIFNYMDMLN